MNFCNYSYIEVEFMSRFPILFDRTRILFNFIFSANFAKITNNLYTKLKQYIVAE